MNILFIAQRYHPFVGGVETQTRLVAKELAKEHHVAVAAMTFEEDRIPQRLKVLADSLLAPPYDSYQDGPVAVHSLTPSWQERLRLLPIAARAIPRLQRYFFHELRAFGYRWFRSVYLPRLQALMRETGAEVVHSVAGGYLGWAAQEAAEALGLPFVLTPYVHPGQHGDSEVDAAFYCEADAVLALLDTDRQFLVDLGVPEEKLHLYGVVPLVPEEAFPVAFRERHGLEEAAIVLFVGRMTEYKGVPAILEAAPEVWAERPETHFLFIGPSSEAMQQRLETADERIRYLGFVSEQEKADALAACDVFCMPSSFEILPAVYLEAWSFGRPVIGGPANGLRELIEGNEAGVVAEQAPEAVAGAVLSLLRDPERRECYGKNGRRLVEERYSVEALVSVLEQVYREVRAAPLPKQMA